MVEDSNGLPRVSAFRGWVYNLWVDNWEERLTYGETPVNIQEYWHAYKHWLRREYQHQQRRAAIRAQKDREYASRLGNNPLAGPRP